ncbi:hypothetical protein J8J14_15430 [Roseomonas sp. SSH11]|uniref:Alkylhydroperoxidase n=1 Tax=Pararoseomonas baculiformis TaxID=2820812 RepID=A0ABS4AGN2_9PROT|nr:hypothetical protein [Pararoseomonas baculiformis]MBP0446165.1 hypothetical protein [Pararoseomonas baculiformis]
MFLRTIGKEEATGAVADIYARQAAQLGFVMEATRCFTARPDLLPIYTEFSDRIRAGFSLGVREWRLITLIAAKHIPSSYCSLVYGQQLVVDLGSRDAVVAVQRDFRSAGLPARDVAMLAYAEAVARDASRIGQHDIDALRIHGFTDTQICDIALCAAFRCFVSRFFDAMGARAEPRFEEGGEAFREGMAAGGG